MTSRVQKGGPIFRPVAKSRSRPPSSSLTPTPVVDAYGNRDGEVVFPVSRALNSMLPPLTIPNRTSTYFDRGNSVEGFADVMSTSHSDVLPSDTTLSVSEDSQNCPQSDTASQIVVEPTRATPIPEAGGGQRIPVPIAVSRPIAGALPTRIGTPSVATPLPTSRTLDVTAQDRVHNILHHSDLENVPRLALNSESTVKPRNKWSTGTTKDNSGGMNEDNSEPNTEGKKRRRTTSNLSKQKRSKEASSPSNSEFDDEEREDATARKKKKSTPNGTPSHRRSRAPSLPPFDANADPGEDIDPTVVTMAALCNDMGQGRVSSKAAEIQSNHALWKAQSKEKRARMKALMEMKKYGREEEEGEENNNAADPSSTGQAPEDPGTSTILKGTPVPDDSGSGFDYSQDMATSRFNVQVRIGPNGETIIDEDSLVVDRAEAEDTADYTHVVESDNTKFINSGSYGKRFRGSRWSVEETERFYDALSQYGENYELIAYVLPGRDRKSCKNKFKIEDKRNHARINYCLNNSIPVDMKTLSQMTGKDFSGPVPDIRAPTPQAIAEPDAPTNSDPVSSPQASRKKKSRNKNRASNDDGIVILGNTETFDPE